MPRFNAHTHDHDCSEHDCSGAFSLYKQVDTARVRALNCAQPDGEEGVAKLFRAWEDRLNTDVRVDSDDDDPEMIIFVPFTSDVKLKSIAIVGGSGGAAPETMRVWTNRDDIDFSTANDVNPLQEWTLADVGDATALEYPTRYTKFQGVSSITIHFPRNFRGSGTLSLHFIGLKGESTQNRREPIGTFVYEALPSAKDHCTVAKDRAPTMPIM